MKIDIQGAGESMEVELAEGATLRVGGSAADGLCVVGLPPALVLLRANNGRLVVEPLVTLAVGGVPCPPHVPRLLMADERVKLAAGVTLGTCTEPSPEAPRAAGGTVALLRGFLGSSQVPVPTRAATVTCLTGLDLGRTYPLADGPNELGRGEHVAIRIRDRAVSRRHARIVLEPAGCFIEDLGGPNGVFVNGERLEARRPLEGGEVLELGHSLLRFTAAPKPPGPARPEAAPAEIEATAPFDMADLPPEEPPVTAPMGPPSRHEEPPVTAPLSPRYFQAFARQSQPDYAWLLVAVGAVSAVLGTLVTFCLAR